MQDPRDSITTRGISQQPWLKQLLMSRFSIAQIIAVSAFLAFSFLLFFQLYLKNHPYFQYSLSWIPNGYLPPSEQTDSTFLTSNNQTPKGDWSIQAFFYTIGAWPVRFDSRPVFFTLPYEKGPPQQFIGRIHARWEMPDILMTWEGPKTPKHLGNTIPLSELEACFLETSTYFKPSCYQLRKTTLERHKQEIEEHLRRARASVHWNLRWFEVDNSLLPLSERPKGVYITGYTQGSLNQDLAEDRFILVLPNGIQQTFILQRPLNAKGDLAKVLFEHSLRSLRVFPRLDEGRLWAAKELRQIKLANLPLHAHSSTTLAEHISRAQLRLLSKLSVDPASRDAYFHLGGTSGLLARTLHKKADSQRTLAAEESPYLLEESAATAKPNTLSALAYFKDLGLSRNLLSSKDVEIEEKKTSELQKLADEVRRY